MSLNFNTGVKLVIVIIIIIKDTVQSVCRMSCYRSFVLSSFFIDKLSYSTRLAAIQLRALHFKL